MSVRTAIERRDEAIAQAPARPPLAHVARSVVDRQKEMLAAILPRGADPERFVGMALQAIKKTPALLNCFATPEGEISFVVAMNQAAIAGLEPNTPTEDCWILPRKVREKDPDGGWVERQEAELQISYKGYIRLAYRSARIASVDATVVYEADDFEHYRALPHDVFRHRASPLPRAERGQLTHAYCLVRYVTGAHHLTVLDREQVEKRREKSESWQADERRRQRDPEAKQWSPWNTWEEEMFLKTAVKAARAFMDLTPELAEAIAADGQQLGYDAERKQVVTQPFDLPPTGRELTDARDAASTETAAIGPALEEKVSDGPAPANQRPATKPQLTAVNTLLGSKRGLADDERFPYLSEWADRPIASTKDLTFEEAGLLIKQLGDMPDAATQDGAT